MKDPCCDERCSEKVCSRAGRWPSYSQCTRKPWRDGKCKQHHPETVKVRRDKSREEYAAQQRYHNWKQDKANLHRAIAEAALVEPYDQVAHADCRAAVAAYRKHLATPVTAVSLPSYLR